MFIWGEEGRSNAVGTTTGHVLDVQWVRVQVDEKKKKFHFSISSRIALRSTQSPV
jgi:hypothetical protein